MSHLFQLLRCCFDVIQDAYSKKILDAEELLADIRRKQLNNMSRQRKRGGAVAVAAPSAQLQGKETVCLHSLKCLSATRATSRRLIGSLMGEDEFFRSTDDIATFIREVLPMFTKFGKTAASESKNANRKRPREESTVLELCDNEYPSDINENALNTLFKAISDLREGKQSLSDTCSIAHKFARDYFQHHPSDYIAAMVTLMMILTHLHKYRHNEKYWAIVAQQVQEHCSQLADERIVLGITQPYVTLLTAVVKVEAVHQKNYVLNAFEMLFRNPISSLKIGGKLSPTMTFVTNIYAKLAAASNNLVAAAASNKKSMRSRKALCEQKPILDVSVSYASVDITVEDFPEGSPVVTPSFAISDVMDMYEMMLYEAEVEEKQLLEKLFRQFDEGSGVFSDTTVETDNMSVVLSPTHVNTEEMLWLLEDTDLTMTCPYEDIYV